MHSCLECRFTSTLYYKFVAAYGHRLSRRAIYTAMCQNWTSNLYNFVFNPVCYISTGLGRVIGQGIIYNSVYSVSVLHVLTVFIQVYINIDKYISMYIFHISTLHKG